MKSNFVVGICLTMLLAATFGLAQGSIVIHANIPHEFTVNGKVLPAGKYDFAYDSSQMRLTIKDSVEGSSGVALTVLTRLAGAIHTTPQDSHVVFDKIGNKYLLSELWIPGLDGFELLSTKERHEHEIINVPR
jgi:hypothetical protein